MKTTIISLLLAFCFGVASGQTIKGVEFIPDTIKQTRWIMANKIQTQWVMISIEDYNKMRDSIKTLQHEKQVAELAGLNLSGWYVKAMDKNILLKRENDRLRKLLLKPHGTGWQLSNDTTFYPRYRLYTSPVSPGDKH